jgi:hypothetical protein
VTLLLMGISLACALAGVAVANIIADWWVNG